MSLPGFELLREERSPERLEVELRVVDAAHPLFDGHFEGAPLVPGFALLALVQTLVAAWLPGKRLGTLSGVRFREALLPASRGRLVVERAGDDGGSFALRLGERLACSGRFGLAEAPR